MKSFSLPLSKSGQLRWVTQHYGINGWKRKPMVIPKCARCLGIFIFWKSKNPSIPVFSITAVHLPPYVGRSIDVVRSEFYKNIEKELKYSEPYFIIFGGGRIDTPQNVVHYKRSIDKFIKPLKFKYQNLQIGVRCPTENTLYTTMVLDKVGNVFFKRTLFILKNP